jgi:hypothetical protein
MRLQGIPASEGFAYAKVYQLTQDKLPLGVMFGNDVVLFDGHHRIAAEILNGAKEIKMLIIKA